MTTTTSQESQAFRVVCPPVCKQAEDMDRHEVDEDGWIEVNHEVDFGAYTFGNVIQRLAGPVTESYVTVNDIPHQPSTDVAVLRRFAADLLDAADWLESLR